VHFAGYLDRNTALLDCYAAANVFRVRIAHGDSRGWCFSRRWPRRTRRLDAELGTRSVLKSGSAH